MTKHILCVAEITTGQPERWAVLSIDPTRKAERGGVVATIVSLHPTKAAADAETVGQA